MSKRPNDEAFPWKSSMGKAPAASRLVIWAHPDFLDHPSITALVEKGHRVYATDDLIPEGDCPADLILDPVAHVFRREWLDKKGLLDTAIKSARARKRGKK